MLLKQSSVVEHLHDDQLFSARLIFIKYKYVILFAVILEFWGVSQDRLKFWFLENVYWTSWIEL